MKKLLSIIIILVSMFVGMQNTYAQSVSIGYVNSAYTVNEGSASTAMNGNGLYLGADYDYAFASNLSLNPGVFIDYVNYNVYRNVHGNAFYVRVPIHVKYSYQLDNMIELFGTAGPSLTYALGGKTRYHDGGISYSEKLFDEYDNRFDIPLGLQIGANLNKTFKVTLGYDFGLLNQAKEVNYKLVKNIFHAGIGYNF